MNYLAHAVLAKPNLYSLTGNLLGDFSKGVQLVSLHPDIRAGLLNHRATDSFTDQHTEVKHLKTLFSPTRRRFAGIALDVLFDHFLIKHWRQFYESEFADYKQQLYRNLAKAEPLMPMSMANTMRSVRTHDWFSRYQQLPQLGVVLDRIASRIRFTHQFAGIIDEITPQYTDYEQSFLRFYPQLQQHIHQLALET